MPTVYAPPIHAPPVATNMPTSGRVDADGVPDEPPPAYSAAPGGTIPEQSVAQGPQYMNFDGPPPTNHQSLPPQPNVGALNHSRPTMMGNSSQSWAGPSSSGWGASSGPAPSLPPRQGSQLGPSVPPGQGPTQQPIPGRPLLNEGKVLIYPKGSFCPKCHNTGFKNDDPHHPCKQCWKKHSKPYTQALAHSWPTNNNDAIDTTTQAQNFQRPMMLTTYHPQNQVGGQPSYPQPQAPVMNNSILRPGMIASGGQTNRLPSGYFPGHPVGPPQGGGFNHPGHPPPGPQYSHHQHGPPPTMIVSHGGNIGGWGGMRVPHGSIVVQPGDPRLGGMPCFKCGGTGEVIAFFGFDNDLCRACQGVGRVY